MAANALKTLLVLSDDGAESATQSPTLPVTRIGETESEPSPASHIFDDTFDDTFE